MRLYPVSLFSRNGFHQTTVQDICLEARLSSGALYRYFDGKEDIIEACCRETQRLGITLVRAARQRKETLTAFGGLVAGVISMLERPGARTSSRLDN